MDCNEQLSKIISNLYLKHQLIYKSEKEMLDVYKDLDSYRIFLETAYDFIQNEPAYFYLEEFLIEKIMTVVNKFRFDYIKEEGINDLVNSIIISANSLKFNMNNIEYITPIITNYVNYEIDMRDINFEDDIELLAAMGQDYLVFWGLVNNLDELYKDEFFLISTNYFINSCPEIYEFPKMKERTIQKLQDMSKINIVENPIIHDYVKSTNKAFQKIK